MEERKRLEDAMAADVELVGDNEIANLWDGDKKMRWGASIYDVRTEGGGG